MYCSGLPCWICLTLCLRLFQEEGSGFLPACLSVGLLLSVRLQTHASVIVQPVEWEVRRAGDEPLPVFGRGAALHHPHQAQHLQEQLELRRYELRAPLDTNVHVVKFLKRFVFPFSLCFLCRGYR